MDELLKLVPRAGVRSESDVLSLFDATAVRLAYTAAGATGRVGSTVGTGTAVLCYVDAAGSIVETTTEIDIINVAVDPVGATKYIDVIRLGNRWKVIWEECPSA